MTETMSMEDAAARICELHPGLSPDKLAGEVRMFNREVKAAFPDANEVGKVIRRMSESECSGIVRAAGKMELAFCHYDDRISVTVWDAEKDAVVLRCNIQM